MLHELFIVFAGNGHTLLGMPDIKLLNILTISGNKTGTEKEDKDAYCSTDIVSMMQEVSSIVPM